MCVRKGKPHHGNLVVLLLTVIIVNLHLGSQNHPGHCGKGEEEGKKQPGRWR